MTGSSSTTRLICKNAGTDSKHLKRVARRPGPYCATCRRIQSSATGTSRHDAYVVKTYGLLPGEYALLLASQNGKCAICPSALTATRRRYAVDHDHAKEKLVGIRHSVRGLLCKRHNNLLRDVRDNVQTLQAAIDYLLDPPAVPILKGVQ